MFRGYHLENAFVPRSSCTRKEEAVYIYLSTRTFSTEYGMYVGVRPRKAVSGSIWRVEEIVRQML